MKPENATPQNLDATQYSTESILHYEAVWGIDFVSPGGYDFSVELINQFELDAGSRVLDVGCGLGGSAFVMASKFKFVVEGIDLSRNMLALATQKCAQHKLTEQVSFEHKDCLKLDCADRYDGIYSRDVFLHIANKARLFTLLNNALRPGKKLLFTDYCCGEKPWHNGFSAYVKNRGYSLHTIPEYARLIADAGFIQVTHQDISNRFIEMLYSDLKTIAKLDLPQPVREQMQIDWQGKLTRAKSGDHRWGLFCAMKKE